MFTLTNNEGKKITVSEVTFETLKRYYDSGIWCSIVKDIAGNTHSVILPDNF